MAIPHGQIRYRRARSTWGEAVVCSIQGIYLMGWAVVGIFLWIPKLFGALAWYSIALVQSALTGGGAEPARRHMQQAADFYRDFVGTMESVRTPAEDGSRAERRARPLTVVREAAWVILVWYVILWPTGVVAAPVELWTGALEAVASLPTVFRG